MRKFLISFAMLLASHAASFAQPSPIFSTCVLAGGAVPCQYRFRSDGGLDAMTVTVTLLDAGGAAVVGWPTTCTLVPNPGTTAICVCCDNPQTGVTGPGGIIVYTWGEVGGRGTLDVVVGAPGSPVAFVLPITFTSPDLNGSCELAPAVATTLPDLGIWAGCLGAGAYCVESDYNCDGVIGVVDLGVWAGGLLYGCVPDSP